MNIYDSRWMNYKTIFLERYIFCIYKYLYIKFGKNNIV